MSGDVNRLCLACMQYALDERGICTLCGASAAEGPQLPHHLAPRTVLNGKYLSARVLGEGGFGITYLGWDINLEVKVAIKEYYPLGAVTRNTTVNDQVTAVGTQTSGLFNLGRERFIDEARRLAKFYSLPGIVSVKDFFLENGTAYIVMEFVEGVTLKAYLEQNGNCLPEATVLELMKPLIRSLAEVHRAGVIHRDISPDNIMIGPDGQLRLIDFGAARDFQDENKSLSVLLKPGYAPEEQYRSRGRQGPWTDVYALSATIFRAIEGDKPPESMERMFEDSFAGFTVPVSQSTKTALMKGLSVRQEGRWQNMEELYAALYGVSQVPPVTLAQAAQAAPPAAGHPMAGQPLAAQGQPGGYSQQSYGGYAQPPAAQPAAMQPPAAAPVAAPPYPMQPPGQKPKNNRMPLLLAVVGVLALAAIITFVATRGGGGVTPRAGQDAMSTGEDMSPAAGPDDANAGSAVAPAAGRDDTEESASAPAAVNPVVLPPGAAAGGVYEGDVDANGLAGGQGRWEYDNHIYEGEWQNGMPNGPGVLTGLISVPENHTRGDNYSTHFTMECIFVDGIMDGTVYYSLFWDYGNVDRFVYDLKQGRVPEELTVPQLETRPEETDGNADYLRVSADRLYGVQPWGMAGENTAAALQGEIIIDEAKPEGYGLSVEVINDTHAIFRLTDPRIQPEYRVNQIAAEELEYRWGVYFGEGSSGDWAVAIDLLHSSS